MTKQENEIVESKEETTDTETLTDTKKRIPKSVYRVKCIFYFVLTCFVYLELSFFFSYEKTLIGLMVLFFIIGIFKRLRWYWYVNMTVLFLLLIGGASLFEYVIDAKPIIYLYPTEQTEVTVKLGNPQNLTHTYPKYADKWQVIAQPNGDLTDIQTKRSLYALYWEGINHNKPEIKEGFVVKGEDTILFLEEKLALLGLNEREANEFIIYWLPKLENSPYNYIRFKTIAEQDKNMPLYISPKPDTVIRVMMAFKNLNAPIEVEEQVLPETPQRNGFTVVEWGGTDLTGNIVR